MKQLFYFTMLIAAELLACNENKQGVAGETHSRDSIIHSHSENQNHLVLNDGKKWKLDEATRNNIDSIKKTVQAVSLSEKKDYAKAAIDLENAANRLVSQCRMSGKDHDMLHVWLESFLSDLKQLKASSAEEQPIAFGRIETSVKEFGDYFE